MTNSGFPRNSAAPTGAPADPPGDEAAAEALDSIEEPRDTDTAEDGYDERQRDGGVEAAAERAKPDTGGSTFEPEEDQDA